MHFDLPAIEDEDGTIEGQWFDVISPRRLTEERRENLQIAGFAIMQIPEMKDFVKGGGDLSTLAEDNPAALAAIIGAEPRMMVRVMTANKYALIVNHVRAWSFGDVTEDVLRHDIPAEYSDFMSKRIEDIRNKLAEPSLTEPDPKALPTSPSASSVPI